MRTMFRASLALASLSLSASAFAAGAPAAAAGTATGTLTANDKAATVKLAQAVKTADGWIVKISDVAPPDNDYDAVGKGTLHVLTLTLGPKGDLEGWQVGHQGLEGLFLSTSLADLKITKLGPDVVEGTVKRTPDTYGPNKIAFDVAFKASVKK